MGGWGTRAITALCYRGKLPEDSATENIVILAILICVLLNEEELRWYQFIVLIGRVELVIVSYNSES